MKKQRRLCFGIKTTPHYPSHEAILDVWQAADALPVFEHAWLNDHFMGDNPGDPYLEAWTLLAALAVQTQRLRVGVMVSGNTYRHPAVLTKMATTVDVLSHGRLNFGIGTGWAEREHHAYGIPLPSGGERVRRLAEACELIRRLWTEPVANFAGRYYQLDEAYSAPKPIQRPHPPVAIGANGEYTLRVVAQYADLWDCSVDTPDEYQRKSTVLENHCSTIGRDPATITRVRHISVDPDSFNMTRQETRTFIEVGATYIIYHIPVPDSQGILQRLAREVAEPLNAEYPAEAE